MATDPKSIPGNYGATFYSGTVYAQGIPPAVYGQAIYGASAFSAILPPLRLRQWRIRPIDTGWTITRTPGLAGQ